MVTVNTNTDINSIVQQYGQNWQTKYIIPLLTKKNILQKQKATLGNLDTLLTDLKSKADGLRNPGVFLSKKAEALDTNVLIAKVTNAQTANAGVYSVNVLQLARAHKVSSGQFSNSGLDIITQEQSGDKTFRITINGIDTDVNVHLNETDTNQAILKNIAFKINASGTGVSASILNEAGSLSRLIITSKESGIINTVSLQDITGTLLKKTNFLDGFGVFLNELQTARDSLFTIDTLNFQRSSNIINDAIEGVSLNILKENSLTEVNVSVDTQAIQGLIQNFLSAYNDAASYLQKEGAYNVSTKTAGSLYNSNFDRQIPNRIKTLLFLPVNTLAPGLNSLFSIGIGSDATGKFVIKDENLLKEKLSHNPQAVAEIFNTPDNGISIRMSKYLGQVIGSSGKRITDSIAQIENRIGVKSKELANYTKNLQRKFSDLEKRLMLSNAYMSQWAQQSNRLNLSW